MNRRPPAGNPDRDGLAHACGITVVTFTRPLDAGIICHYCNEAESTTRDHIVPDSVGGSRQWWNLVPACAPCNGAKADRQSCSCLFCVRAIALWGLGFKARGKSYREKRHTKAGTFAPGPDRPHIGGLSDDQQRQLARLLNRI